MTPSKNLFLNVQTNFTKIAISELTWLKLKIYKLYTARKIGTGRIWYLPSLSSWNAAWSSSSSHPSSQSFIQSNIKEMHFHRPRKPDENLSLILISFPRQRIGVDFYSFSSPYFIKPYPRNVYEAIIILIEVSAIIRASQFLSYPLRSVNQILNEKLSDERFMRRWWRRRGGGRVGVRLNWEISFLFYSIAIRIGYIL